MDAKSARAEKRSRLSVLCHLDPFPAVQEMVKSLKLGNSAKTNIANLEPIKDGSLSDATPCLSSVDAVSSKKETESDQDAQLIEQSMYNPMPSYYGYCYPGYDMQFAQWNGQAYMVGTDCLEMQQPIIQPDSGSFVYYMPGVQPGYTSYTTSLSPGAVVGVDSQYQGQQTYVTSPVTPQPLSTVYFPPSMGYGYENLPVGSWDSSYWNLCNGNGYNGNCTPATKPKLPEKLQQSNPITNSKSSPIETTGSSPFMELPLRSEGSNVHIGHADMIYIPSIPMKPAKKAFGQSRRLPATKLPHCSYPGKGGLLYPVTPTSIEGSGQSWISTENIRTRNMFNEFGDPDLLNKQHCGPRTNTSRNTSLSGVDQAGVPVADIGDICGSKKVIIKRNDYNLSEFPTKYEHASFFVIKSYSEDDVHKSIKYNVWSSTPNGNKRLDIAFQVAQERTGETGSECHVFLFFSVNASGQFCGVAEMIGRVDFQKNMDFWQQDKWTGFFPVKWHIVKDVPNSQFRHIVLENNDNKPVTNSRDTQEVKFTQGHEMLKIFKAFSNKTSVLDDFGFYENRQKIMQDKTTKPKLAEATRVEKSSDVKPIISAMEAIELDSSKMIENIPQIAAVN